MTNNENKEYFEKIGLNPGEEYKIKLEYFDYKGDYCGCGEFLTKKSRMFHVDDEIMSMKLNKCLPNMEGDCDVTIYVDASEHPNGFPMLYHAENIDMDRNKNLNFDMKSVDKIDKEHEIKLEYFKSSGKYYTEGEFTTKESEPNKIFEKVCKLKSAHKLPGVAWGDFTVYIDATNHPNGFKKILFNK